MKRIFSILWSNKQLITGTLTGSLSALAAAGMMSAELVVKITTVTGIVTAVLALAYTLFTAKVQPPEQP